MNTLMKNSELEKTDFLIIGSGVAAMRCATAVAPAGQVLMLAKHAGPARPSKHSNGMIAIATNEDEGIRLHYEDTVCAGEGLCKPAAVKMLVEEGPKMIEELISWGAEFQLDAGKFLIPKEGAKPRPYTYRGRAQSTVNEIFSVLQKRCAGFPQINMLPDVVVEDLVVHDGAVVGARFLDTQCGRRQTVCAKAVFLGTGGLGQIYTETTNSDLSTGDGLALAFRAGAELSDMEFVEFHPTVLHLKNAPRILLPESLRAEGAYLRNADLERFMRHYHSQEELAPRDVVSRAILKEMSKTQSGFVYLDCTHLDSEILKKRFPSLFQMFLDFNIDISENMIPVHPAAHYCIGGIKIDVDGKTSLPRLFAAGEVSCSGVHGSNRLPTNSLLESLVFGARAGAAMAATASTRSSIPIRANGGGEKCGAGAKARLHIDEFIARLKKLMWQNAGIIRSGNNLRHTIQNLRQLEGESGASETLKHDSKLRNLLSVAHLVAASALAREESRGAHYREDFPLRKDPRFLKHSIISKDSRVDFAD